MCVFEKILFLCYCNFTSPAFCGAMTIILTYKVLIIIQLNSEILKKYRYYDG